MKTLIFFAAILELYTSLQKVFASKCMENNCTILEEKYICRYENLKRIPTDSADAEYLDLTGNFIQRLDENEFFEFTKLKALILSNVSLKVIHRDAFRNLKYLEIVDLSINLLKSFHPETFSENIIRDLNLSKNMFKRLISYQFITPYLETLDLSGNFLDLISNTTFSNVSAITSLNLSDNKLKTLQIKPILLSCSALKNFNLNKNLWLCDCEFYAMSLTPLIYQNSAGLKCETADKEYKYANETMFLQPNCDNYWKQTNIDIVTKVIEKNKYENIPDLILNIYGYVLFGITVLILMCCYCESQNVNAPSIISSRSAPYLAPVIEKSFIQEVENEKAQVHTFGNYDCVEVHSESGTVSRIPVEERVQI